MAKNIKDSMSMEWGKIMVNTTFPAERFMKGVGLMDYKMAKE